jgi:IS5 family transposase
MFITAGSTVDYTQANKLVEGEGIEASRLIADKGYDRNEIVERVQRAGMQVVIPSKRNRKQKAGP